MKLIKVLPYLVVALLVLFGITNDTISSAIISFLIAGIVPGTSIQLPWYVVLVFVPLLLYGVWQLIRSIDFVPKDWVAAEKTAHKSTTKTKRDQQGRGSSNTHHSSKKQRKYNRYTRTTRGRGRKKLTSALTSS